MKTLMFLFMTVALVLAGCSSGGSDKSSGEGESGKGSVDISIVAHPAYSLKASDQKVVGYLKSSISQFEEQNNANVELSAYSSNISEAMAKLIEQASQDRAPDIAQIDAHILPRYYDYLQPLDPYLKKYDISLDDYYPFAKEVMKGPDGKIYGVQFTTDVRVMFYRKDLVPNPPKTWSEVLELGKKLKKQGYYAFLYPAGRGEGTTVTTILPMFWGQGGKLVDDQGKPVFGKGKNKQAMLNVLNFLDQTVKTGITPKRVSTYGSESDLNEEVATGKVAMFLGGNWQASQIKHILGEEEFKKWGVAPIPHKEGADIATTAGGWAWAMFAKDKDTQKAAVDFLAKTFVENEGMAQWSNIGGYLPVRKPVYKTDEYKGGKFTESFKKHLNKYAKARPSSEAYPEISSQLQVAVSSVVSGSKSPEQALADAWGAVKAK
ncbi:MAG TPA: extracellular solute-binding protein [Bacillales bacterium]|nr:extracellular solute-binding protein [Bacillales bacterium]